MDADLVFTRGVVYTMDPTRPKAEAVAVAGDRILAVGHNVEIQGYKGAATRVVDLKGRALIPGFYDAHQHQLYRGLSFQQLDGRADSIQTLMAACATERLGCRPGAGSKAPDTTTVSLLSRDIQPGTTSTWRLPPTLCS